MDATDILIEPSELQTALATGTLLLDVRKPGEFKKRHIPGAIPHSTYEMFVNDSSLQGMRTFAQLVADRFSSVGVRMDRPVVVYDDHTGMRAARELWMLVLIGHRRARMLHGGLAQWIAEGKGVLADTNVATVRPTKTKLSMTTGCNVPIDEVARRAGAWNFTLIDVRDDLEWSGKVKAPCCTRLGHIPHAVHIEWDQFLQKGRFKEPAQIIKLLEDNGVNPRHEIAAYCHHGARSAHTYFALKYAGVEDARNFMGSWHEWSAREDLPIE